MSRIALSWLLVAAVGCSLAMAATVQPPGKQDPPAKEKTPGEKAPPGKDPAEKEVITPPPPPPAPELTLSAEEQQKSAEVQALLIAGKMDEAIEGAKQFLAGAQSDAARNEAMRLTAEAYRKKADWRQAIGAYARLRDRYDKGSQDFARYDAIAEILRASPTGVYQPAGAPKAADGKTLADDEALVAAFARLADVRLAKLKPRALLLKRGRTPQEVVAGFAAAAEEARQVLVVAPDAAPDTARELAAAANARLQELAKAGTTVMEQKLHKYQPKMEAPWNFTNVEKKDVQGTQAACRELAQCERTFQESLLLVAGKGEWPEGDQIRKDSASRRASYEQLVKEFVIPGYITIEVD